MKRTQQHFGAPVTNVSIWSIADIQRHYGISQNRARRLVREPQFPAPLFGVRDRRWKAEEVQRFVESGEHRYAGTQGAHFYQSNSRKPRSKAGRA